MDATEEDFGTAVIERSHELPVVVDFWADWCGPCKMLAPVLEQAIAEREGQIVLAKVDVDANQRLAEEYGIRGIPAVKAFRDGREVSGFVGVQSPQSIASFLDELLGPVGRRAAARRAGGERRVPGGARPARRGRSRAGARMAARTGARGPSRASAIAFAR